MRPARVAFRHPSVCLGVPAFAAVRVRPTRVALIPLAPVGFEFIVMNAEDGVAPGERENPKQENCARSHHHVPFS
jgi:hypothetical protein